MRPCHDSPANSDAPGADPTWSGLFPAAVVTVTQAELAGEPALMPGELGFVARAVPTRVLEFTTGRSCARAALARLGCPPVAIAIGPQREPVWPAGFVGSITHCRGHCAAAAARNDAHVASAIAGVGLDAEPAQPLPADVSEVVCSAAERAWLGQRSQDGLPWDRLVFSAKESVFKCLFPTLRRYVDFHEVDIAPGGDDGFQVRAPDLPLAEQVAIRCAFRAGFILTTAILPNDRS